MSGSTLGKNITISTWGESHGEALGVVVDGFPAGLELSKEDIQKFLDRRKPGTSSATTSTTMPPCRFSKTQAAISVPKSTAIIRAMNR